MISTLKFYNKIDFTADNKLSSTTIYEPETSNTAMPSMPISRNSYREEYLPFCPFGHWFASHPKNWIRKSLYEAGWNFSTLLEVSRWYFLAEHRSSCRTEKGRKPMIKVLPALKDNSLAGYYKIWTSIIATIANQWILNHHQMLLRHLLWVSWSTKINKSITLKTSIMRANTQIHASYLTGDTWVKEKICNTCNASTI